MRASKQSLHSVVAGVLPLVGRKAHRLALGIAGDNTPKFLHLIERCWDHWRELVLSARTPRFPREGDLQSAFVLSQSVDIPWSCSYSLPAS